MKKRIIGCLAFAAVVLLNTVSVFAEPEEEPAEEEMDIAMLAEESEEDVVMLYTGTIPEQTPEGDPLCNYLNEKRDLNGSCALEFSDELCTQAEERVAQLADNNTGADASALDGADACEIVICGNMDVDTMLCSLLLSKQQSKTIFYSGFTAFGYAHSEDETIWVLQFTS
ncbi:MAG: hypothetical protein MJ071_08595 [Oscillospiraceae bacterium]|nr:hypothetical protein [Oscillospiraceae bacterium]